MKYVGILVEYFTARVKFRRIIHVQNYAFKRGNADSLVNGCKLDGLDELWSSLYSIHVCNL